MHTIDNCPRCGIDFMYHNSDYHLERDITIVDEDGNNEVITTVICQDCDLSEKWVGKEVKVKGEGQYTYLNKYKLVVESILSEEYPITVRIADSDIFEWFKENELEIIK